VEFDCRFDDALAGFFLALGAPFELVFSFRHLTLSVNTIVF
jgi:hypothetical protein